MKANEEQVKAVGLMAKNEVVLADLYRVFADKFPGASAFWQDLAHEEELHENILKSFAEGLQTGDFSSRDSVFTANVWASIVDIQGKIAEARVRGMTLKEALIIADTLESNFLEQAYFRVIAGDSDRLKSAFKCLSEDTKRHQGLVKEMLAKCG